MLWNSRSPLPPHSARPARLPQTPAGPRRPTRQPGRIDVEAFVATLEVAGRDTVLDLLSFWQAQGTLPRLRLAGHTGVEIQRMTRALIAAGRRTGLLA